MDISRQDAAENADVVAGSGHAVEVVQVEPVAVTGRETPSFTEGFADFDHADWLELATAVVNRGRHEGSHLDSAAALASLRSRTVDELVLEPLYLSGNETRDLGRPGVTPFTRGRTPLRRESAWDVRQLHDDPDAQRSHEAVYTDLERGATSLWLVVGDDGIDPGDLPAVLADVDLALAPVIVGSWADQDGAAQALAEVVGQREGSAEVQVGFGIDPLGLVAARGGTPDFSALRRWAVRCRNEFPSALVAVVDTRPYHDAGAGDVEELGSAVATGLAYVRELVDEGLDVTTAFGLIEFRIVVTDDQFLAMSKLRALRRMWSRVAQVCGVPEADGGARTHAVTSWRMMARDDPYVNVVRATIACFGAAVGGADAITVLPFDAAIGLPEPFSRRLARNTQILLAEESSLARVLDPAGGSWFVESLTDHLAEAGWSWFQQVESAGGMAAALRDGLVHDRLADVRERSDSRIATRAQPLTGVSSFPDLAESPLARRERATVAPVGGEVAPLPRRRDSEVFERLRDRSRAAAGSDGAPPAVLLACLGSRRDYGAREAFASGLLAAGGIGSVSIELNTQDGVPEGFAVAVLCSSPPVNAERGAQAVRDLRAAGIGSVYLAGGEGEVLGDPGLSGWFGSSSDVVATLTDVLDHLTAKATGSPPDTPDTALQGERA